MELTTLRSIPVISRLLFLRWPSVLAILVCGCVGTALPAIYGHMNGYPEPHIHDEFSYLLAADTFVRGRLTNPAPDLPQFFEAEHVLLSPTYSSKYPPGQGLMLAAGWLVGGHPIWGVWLECGCFAAALCWMLQAWTSRAWALAATFIAIASFGISSYWAQSYWGGMLAATGGALLYGGVRRLVRSPGVSASILLAVGVLLLANTRPYEGAIACIPVVIALMRWLLKSHAQTTATKVTRVLIPMACVFLLGGAAMAVHNRAITGSWKSMPYSIHQQQYFHQDVFLFCPVRPATHTPAVPRIAKFYRDEKRIPVPIYIAPLKASAYFFHRLCAQVQNSLGDLSRGLVQHGAVLWILAFVIPWVIDRRVRFCMLCIGLVVFGNCLTWWRLPHYVAPITPLMLAILAIVGRRNAFCAAYGQAIRPFLPCLIMSLAVADTAYNLVVTLQKERPPAARLATLPEGSPTSVAVVSRRDLRTKLEGRGGRHLVFVRYHDDYGLGDEWVYNSADLAAAPIIFAHDLGANQNSELIALYPDREVWLADVSETAKSLKSYPQPGGSSGAERE